MKRNKFNVKKQIKKKIELNMVSKSERNKLREPNYSHKPIDVNLLTKSERNKLRINDFKNVDYNKQIFEFKFNIHQLSDIPTSIIFSYKESSEDRKRNLQNILKYFSHYLSNNVEIILVEQDVKNKINWLDKIENNKYIKHIFLKNNNIFNKGWGFNVGAKFAKSNHLIFNDSDVLVSPDIYQASIKLLDGFDIINPYKNLYWLNEEETIKLISGDNKTKFKLNRIILSPSVISGGIFLIKKNKFLELKGFDENSFGWGYQDYIFDEKIKKLNLSVKIVESLGIHLHHEGTPKPGVNNIADGDVYYSFKDRNKNIYESYKEMTDIEILEKIRRTKRFGEGGIEI